MGIDSTFLFKSKGKDVVKQQLAKLKKKLKFEDLADIQTQFSVKSSDDLKVVKNFIDTFEKKVTPGLAVGFNHDSKLYVSYSFQEYYTALDSLEKDYNIDDYSLVFSQRSIKTYSKSISLHYGKKNLSKHFSPWLEKNNCKSLIFVSFSTHDQGVKKDIDSLIPFLKETLSIFNIPFSVMEREEYGKQLRYIPVFENGEIYFPELKLDIDNVNMRVFLKKATPLVYFNQLTSLSFFDPTEVSGNYFGNYNSIIEKILQGNVKKTFLWPDNINIYPSFYMKWVRFPTDKMISFILDCGLMENVIHVSFITTVPKELFESQENDVTGEIRLTLNKGEIELSFHMRGYVDIEPVFAKEFGIIFENSFVG